MHAVAMLLKIVFFNNFSIINKEICDDMSCESLAKTDRQNLGQTLSKFNHDSFVIQLTLQ